MFFLDCPEYNIRNAFWIGARRRIISDCYSPLEWKSNNGSTFPIQYSNWAQGEPNCGAGNSEACGSIDKTRDSKWNDIQCTRYACPLCEVMVHV